MEACGSMVLRTLQQRVPPTQDNPDVGAALGLPPVSWEGAGWGMLAVAIGVVASILVRWAMRAYLHWRGRSASARDVFSRLAGIGVVVLAVGVALAIIFPSVKPVDLLGGVGIISIAAGIAFQTVLGNMFAGIVILARGQYVVGDQIGVREIRGEVTAITLNSTQVRSFDGRQVVLPNQVMHSEPVIVQTGYAHVRTTMTVQIDAVADPTHAQRVAVEAMDAVPVVAEEPMPQALLTTLDKGALTLELRFWSGARQLETREAQHAVIAAVLAAFKRTGVKLADEIQTIEAGPDLLTALDEAGQAPS